MKAAIAIALLGVMTTYYLATNYNPTNFGDEKWTELYTQYLTKHGKSYFDKTEFALRKEIFRATYLKIEEHNSGNHLHKEGLNHFSDQTQEEFETLLGLVVPEERTLKIKTTIKKDRAPRMESVNWYEKGFVQDVKDQKACGSCWAFSAIAAVESRYNQKHELTGADRVSFSEQQLVDCSYSEGNLGCLGGWMDQAFDHLEKHGACTTDEYVYTGRPLSKCHETDCEHKEFEVADYFDLLQDPAALDDEIEHGPIAVAVDASNWSRYESGIFEDCQTKLNHGVLLVGINVEQKAWIIKNSWGPRWGEEGFMRLSAGNTCGICDAASVPETY